MKLMIFYYNKRSLVRIIKFNKNFRKIQIRTLYKTAKINKNDCTAKRK